MHDGYQNKKGSARALANRGALEVRPWSSLDRRFDMQDARLQHLDTCMNRESELVEAQSTHTHAILIAHLTRLIERRFEPSQTLLSMLAACDGGVLARLFIPALESRDEPTFIEALERLAYRRSA